MDLADCMAALGLADASYSVPQLKAQYKALALELHPDKKRYEPEEATARFKVLTSAYKRLLEAHAALREHADLKASFQDHVGGAGGASFAEPPVDPNKKFNAKKFNEVFQKTRVKTVEDGGYGRWMSTAPPAGAASASAGKQIQVYKEPVGLPAASRGLAFNELGLDKIKDFSGDNSSDRKLNYMDIKVAHTSTIIPDEPTSASWTRQSFKNVDALEKARADPRSLKLTAQETARLARSQIKSEAREAQRQHTLRMHDSALEARHRSQRQLMFTG